MKKRFFAIVLALALAFTMMPAMGFADDGSIEVKVTIKNNNFVTTLVSDDGKKVNPTWTGPATMKYPVKLKRGETAQNAIERACKENEIKYVIDDSWGSAYFTSIEGMGGGISGILIDTYGSGQYYDMSGWMFLINGAMPGYNAASDMINSDEADADKQLKNGDEIILAYSIDNQPATADKAFAQGVKLNKKSLNLKKSKSEKLTATIFPSYGAVASKGVTWKSSKAAVAKVDSNGKVTAVAPGSASITARASNGLVATCKVVVAAEKAKPVKLTKPAWFKVKRAGKKFVLSWSKVKGATSYQKQVKRKGTKKWKVLKRGNKLSATKFRTIKADKWITYQYRVRAVRKAGGKVTYGPWSKVRSIRR